MYSLSVLCLGCGEPLVVPVDVTMGDGKVAQSGRDADPETPDAQPPAGEDLDAGSGASDADVVAADADTRADASSDSGRPRGEYTCINLPDPVVAASLGDSGTPHTDVVHISTDQDLGCGMAAADGGLDMGGMMLHGNYERVDGTPILRAGTRYALSAAPGTAPLDVHVLVARIISGNAPCEESEQLGSIAITQPFVDGACTDLDPKKDARFLRLPVELSALFVSAPLRLCDVPCSDL
jgi:hypothetical protein